MTRTRWPRVAALTALALLLLVAGAALRPLFLAEPSASSVEVPRPDVLNPAEIGFAQDMAAHHQQAIVMVQRLDPAVDPTVHRLAQQIGDAQRFEIGTMIGWLRLAGAPITNPSPMSWMGSHDRDGHHEAAPSSAPLMPGMATFAELNELGAARGEESAILFLQLMQRHHVAGVEMAQAADSQLIAGAVKQTAREMFQAQSQEIGEMTLMLAQLGAPPLP